MTTQTSAKTACLSAPTPAWPLLTYGNWRGAQAQRTANPCVPAGLAWWFFCPCHASTIDFAERVIKYQPAPSHLVVPPLPDLTTMHLLAGEDDNGLV